MLLLKLLVFPWKDISTIYPLVKMSLSQHWTHTKLASHSRTFYSVIFRSTHSKIGLIIISHLLASFDIVSTFLVTFGGLVHQCRSTWIFVLVSRRSLMFRSGLDLLRNSLTLLTLQGIESRKNT